MPAGADHHPQSGFQKGHPPYKRKKLEKPPKPPRLNKDGTPRKPHVIGRPFAKGVPPPVGRPYKKGENRLHGKGPNRKRVLPNPLKPNEVENLPLASPPERRALSIDEHLKSIGFDALAEIMKMLDTPIKDELRAKLLCDVMSYQYSRRRSIEISGQDSGPIQVVIRRWSDVT